MPEVMFQIGMTLDQLEKLAILKAYSHFRNKTATANSLGIAIRTLDYKLEQYQKEEDAQKEKDVHASRQRADHLARARGNPPNNVGIPFTPSSFPPSSDEGLRVESLAFPTPKQTMPMSQREEVQTLPSEQAAKSYSGKRR